MEPARWQADRLAVHQPAGAWEEDLQEISHLERGGHPHRRDRRHERAVPRPDRKGGAGPDCLEYDEEIQRVNMAKTSLMAKKAELEREGRTAAAFDRRMEEIANELEKTAGAITEFDEVTVRQLVSSIKVISKDTLLVCFKDGTEIMQTIGSIGRVRA